jgi:hypothetical protein
VVWPADQVEELLGRADARRQADDERLARLVGDR